MVAGNCPRAGGQGKAELLSLSTKPPFHSDNIGLKRGGAAALPCRASLSDEGRSEAVRSDDGGDWGPICRVPGLGFAEIGPGDLSLSLGHRTIPREPYPAEMQKARDRILEACRGNGVAFLQLCTTDNVIERIDEGVRVIAGHSEATANKGRAHQKRMLPV